MLNRLSWVVILSLLVIGLIPSPGKALILEFPLSELVAQSDVVVRGAVTRTECRWGAPDWDPNATIILTDATVTVTNLLKGATDRSEVIVETEGGEIGDLGLKVEDMPQFQTGEDVIVFLGPENGRAVRSVTGFYTGKYTSSDGSILESGEPTDQFVNRIQQVIDWERRER